MTRVLAVDGVAPGIGKSTVVDALCTAVLRHGTTVVRFDEAEVLAHDTCAELARIRQHRPSGAANLPGRG